MEGIGQINREAVKTYTYVFQGLIYTNFTGYGELLRFYRALSKFEDCKINLSFAELGWFDANLCAVLLAMINKLKAEQGLIFDISTQTGLSEFDVLERNGFAARLRDIEDGVMPIDERDTTIRACAFKKDQADAFVNYVDKEFLGQRGLSKMPKQTKGVVADSFFEIFCNVEIHAETTEPIYTCGQYFPVQDRLKFTLVDLGQGFLHKIAKFTKEDRNPVSTAVDAIIWAISGGSTKEEAKGGTGLRGILDYCHNNGGALHIITDNCYWVYADGTTRHFKIYENFPGTTLHLIFKTV